MSKNLFIEIIKTDLKNSITSGMLTPQQQLITINTALRDLSSLDNEQINNVIKKYRDKQKELEEIFENTQKKILENAVNIYEHLMREL